MNIGIVGSRTWVNKDIIFRTLDIYKNIALINGQEFKIISGGARGVDTFAIEYAKDKDIKYEIIRPLNYKLKVSYLYRNIEIITKADFIVAFWDGKSSGTSFVIDYAKKRGIPTFVYNEEGYCI